MTQLRDYQGEMVHGVRRAWDAGARDVLAVLPTGGGKTTIFTSIMGDFPRPSVAIAHRQELVAQISVALGRAHVRHGIVAPKAVTKNIVKLHMEELGANYYDPSAKTKVAGVDTLIRLDPRDPWFAQVGLWVQDEAHHVLEGNKWGKAAAMFPNARGLGVMATPRRADGKGLGRHHDGLFDCMVEGPTQRALIERGYLADYDVLCPPNDIDLGDVGVGASGDFVQDKLRKAVHKSKIVGDVVEHYLRHAAGKRGVTFAVDVEHATEMAAAYNARGVPAAVLHGEMDDSDRASIMRRFRRGELLQLTNCDLLGEGVDVPAIEVVSFARPTASFGLYIQQFGRALRLFLGKLRALIIDHVGNVVRHGLPDRRQVWTLDRREKGVRNAAPDDVVPLRACLSCSRPFDRVLLACPICKTVVEPVGRGAPSQVEGDLILLTPETLAKMRGEIERVDAAPFIPPSFGAAQAGALKRSHWERQQAQATLREAMSLYGGVRTAAGDTVSAMQARFWHVFGVDVATAQTLNAADAAALERKVLDVVRMGN